MPETLTDAELVRNITLASDQESSQTKINRHLKRFVALRVVLPIAVVGAAAYVANRLSQDTDTQDTDEN